MKHLTLARQRRDLMDTISILRSRHRKRKALQKLLVQLTTKQLRCEIRSNP
jgi:hypothetical protein